MPYYEYQCDQCGARCTLRLTVPQYIEKEKTPPLSCFCGGVYQRVFSAAAFRMGGA